MTWAMRAGDSNPSQPMQRWTLYVRIRRLGDRLSMIPKRAKGMPTASKTGNYNRGGAGLIGASKALAPRTRTLRTYTLSPHVATTWSKFAPPKQRFEHLPLGVGRMQLT